MTPVQRSRIVLGVGASHSTLMNTHWEQTQDKDAATRFKTALAQAEASIAAAFPDAVVIIGSNHFRGFWLDLMPAFTIGIGECIASGESGTPAGPQRVDTRLARHLASDLTENSAFDVAFSARLQIDHGQSHAIQYLLAGRQVPIVPVVINVFAPPLPTLRRCEEFGRALRDAITSFAEPRRVAVIASGGLSHQLPWPDWRDPNGDDEEFIVQAWLNGRGDWSSYDTRRRDIIRAAEPDIRTDFDREFLALIESGHAAQIADWSSQQLDIAAGNGGQEIRTWMAMAASLSHAPGRRLAYEPIAEWLTGMAVAIITPRPDEPGNGAP